MRTTRLAPSPTGALHLGNARTFVINWIMARRRGWKVILRVEDLDGPRIKQGADLQAIEDLKWLGIDWDEGPTYQSSRLDRYSVAVHKLVGSGNAYYCVCSRSEVAAAASAPHAEDGAAVYPGTCRGRFKTVEEANAVGGREPAVRFAVRPGRVCFDDVLCGRRCWDVARELGDFVVAKADGTPAYQLAVVVDDGEMGVTDVVRGDDLLDSTPRQVLLYKALGMEPKTPRYAHLPLIVGEDGRRLAKRHGDTRLATYRAQGVNPGRVLALLARWSGLEATDSVTMEELVRRLECEKMPREKVVFTHADDLWLRDQG